MSRNWAFDAEAASISASITSALLDGTGIDGFFEGMDLSS
jgi:hypothetical protein